MSKRNNLFTQDKRKGYYCQCCGLFVKAYARKINSNMALALVLLASKREYGFVHIENYMIEHGNKRSGDFSYLVHWRLVESLKEKREDGSSRNGYYKITSAGIMFAEGKTKEKESAIIFNNRLQGFEGELVDIRHCLGNKFNYDKLIGNKFYN